MIETWKREASLESAILYHIAYVVQTPPHLSRPYSVTLKHICPVVYRGRKVLF